MRLCSVVLSALLLAPAVAKADTFNFNVTGFLPGNPGGSGTLTGNDNGDGSFTITAITGPAGTGTITVLPAFSSFGNDNLFFPTFTSNANSLLDDAGLSFSGAFFNGGIGTVNLFSIAGLYFVQGIDAQGDTFDPQPVELTLNSTTAVTPEPSSILLTFTGLAAGAALVFRKRLLSTTMAPQTLA